MSERQWRVQLSAVLLACTVALGVAGYVVVSPPDAPAHTTDAETSCR